MCDNYFFVSVFLSVIFLLNGVKCDVLCETGYCATYQSSTGCATPAQQCSVNNDTYFGLTLPSPTICNCCDYCLPLYVEGHHCSLGGAGDGTSIGRCADGLTCVEEDDGFFCRRISPSDSECHAAQDTYDERYEQGVTGTLEQRPQCDGRANYVHYHCVPTQTCFCQSTTGERLFGEVLYQNSATTMTCGCTQMHEKIKTKVNPGLRFPVVGPRCTTDGNFNPVQCIDRICYCVDKVTGVIVDDSHVDLDEEPVSELDCYDETLDISPDTSTEPPYHYTTPCLEERSARIQLILDSEAAGYDVSYFTSVPECEPDGSFGPVAVENGTKICIDDHGNRIGDYEAHPDTSEYDTMSCKCAVTSNLMSSSVERPVCCRNGSFRSVQCRRGMCRCVDEDGRQVAPDTTDVSTLPCCSGDIESCMKC